MQAITLITDWKNDSLYSAQIKGKLISISSELNIIELISNIESFDTVKAAFIFNKAYKNFPENTIHLNFIDNQHNDNNNFIVIYYQNQYFVSRDNGFLSLVLPLDDYEIYRISSNNKTFEELDIYPKIIEAILNNKLDKIAEKTDEIIRSIVFTPNISHIQIIGHIKYIDAYGNLITDIRKKEFDEFCLDEKYKIIIKNENNIIEQINKSYSEVDSGDLVAIFNSMGLLELAQNNGNIAEILGIKNNDEFIIEKILEEKNPGTLF